MSNVYTKNITVNGNQADFIATHYTGTMKHKETALATQQAMEEYIQVHQQDCDFEFNKQHETNILYDMNIITDDIKTLTYNTTVKINEDYTFSYPEDCLKDSTEIVYLSDKIISNNDIITDEMKSYDYTAEYNSIDVGINLTYPLENAGVVFIPKEFWNCSTDNSKSFLVTPVESSLLVNHLLYKDKECSENIDETYLETYDYKNRVFKHIIKDVYYKFNDKNPNPYTILTVYSTERLSDGSKYLTHYSGATRDRFIYNFENVDIKSDTEIEFSNKSVENGVLESYIYKSTFVSHNVSDADVEIELPGNNKIIFIPHDFWLINLNGTACYSANSREISLFTKFYKDKDCTISIDASYFTHLGLWHGGTTYYRISKDVYYKSEQPNSFTFKLLSIEEPGAISENMYINFYDYMTRTKYMYIIQDMKFKEQVIVPDLYISDEGFSLTLPTDVNNIYKIADNSVATIFNSRIQNGNLAYTSCFMAFKSSLNPIILKHVFKDKYCTKKLVERDFAYIMIGSERYYFITTDDALYYKPSTDFSKINFKLLKDGSTAVTGYEHIRFMYENLFKYYPIANIKNILMVPENVNEIIVSNKVDVGFSSTVSESFKITYQCATLTDNVMNIPTAKLYVNGSMSECCITKGTNIECMCSELHITARFFENQDLDIAEIGDFGNFSNISFKLFIQQRGLKSKLVGDKLIDSLKSLLCFTGELTLE